ncbi:MAG: hypothetical protein ABI140_20910 [Jatrophihabitantaceae bacterium]
MTAPRAAGPWLWNRLVAFLGPYVAIGSGALAAWLAHNLPGLHLQQQGTAAVLATAAEFLGGVLVTWSLQHKWLDGWQKWEQAAVRIANQVVPDQIHPVPVPAAASTPAITAAAELASAVTEAVLRPSAPQLSTQVLAATTPSNPGPAAVDGITLLPPS